MPMTTFKPGDRVTSPLLVGEWVVTSNATPVTVNIAQDGLGLEVPADTLVFVAPPPPPEPPVGTVGFVDGMPVYRSRAGWAFPSGIEAGYWESFAVRFFLAVPKPTVEQVAEALMREEREGITSYEADAAFMIAYLWPEHG